MQRFHQLVEEDHEVVLGVVNGLARDGTRVVQHVRAFDRGETQRVAQHLGEVVTHQHGLVLVDGEAGVGFSGLERDVDPALLDAVLLQEFGHLLAELSLGVAQVDGVHGVARNRDGNGQALDGLGLVVGQHRGGAAAALALPGAVEVDEVDGNRGARPISRAVAHARADEGEVGIRVERLHRLLLIAQLGPQVELIVAVLGARGNTVRNGWKKFES